jgi:hypothetical protein
MGILVLVGIAVLVVGITALVNIPVKHVEVVLSDLYWRRSKHVGTSHWEKRESPRKPHGEIRNVVNLHAGDPEKKPLWAYEEGVWEGLRWIHADGHDQQYLSWPDSEIRDGEEVKSKKELYRADFFATGAGRYAKTLHQRRWTTLRKDTKYRLGLNTFGKVRTVTPPLSTRARPPAARPLAPAAAPPRRKRPEDHMAPPTRMALRLTRSSRPAFSRVPPGGSVCDRRRRSLGRTLLSSRHSETPPGLC